MVITLADAQKNASNDVDYAVIDDTRRKSWLMDQFIFDDTVTPGTGGPALAYTYTRLTSTRGAQFRAYNTEYTPQEARRTQFTSNLRPLGGAFNIDRVLAHLGPRATDEAAFQLEELGTGVRSQFADSVINGDTTVDVNGFDGLSKSLAGTSTEYFANATTFYTDWSATTVDTQAEAMAALDILDDFLTVLNVKPDALLMNITALARVRALARWASLFTVTKDDLGRQIEMYNGIQLVDVGNKPDDSGPIVPIQTRDPDAGGAGGNITNLTDIYAVKFGLAGLHGASVAGVPLVQTFEPDMSRPGAVKTWEQEMGPITIALKSTRACAVLRNVKVR
jgi:hypothetical protein